MNTGPYYLTIGDFNRDGKLDIMSANNGNNTVGVLLGTGTGTFGAATYYRWVVAPSSPMQEISMAMIRVDLTAVTGTGLSVLLSGESETASITNIAINGCSTQSVTATYDGDGNYGSSTSARLTLTPQADHYSDAHRQPANGHQRPADHLPATLSPYAYGSTTTNGEKVTFTNNGNPSARRTLSNGVAVLSYPSVQRALTPSRRAMQATAL